ncbi:MAG TPA: thioredoxin [Gemmatimonadaceae bacterium]|nr:thioredoxin [Gemmatimonadaceae bacterium]
MAETTKTRTVVVRCPMCATLNRVDLARMEDRPKCAHCGKPILIDRPLAVTDADFDKVIGGAEIPVLVDFYADWCGPCKVMAPVLDTIAHERAGHALVVKLDTDRNPQVGERFGIRGIPTFIVFNGGKEAGRQVGGVPKQALEKLLDAAGGKGGR